MEDANRTLWLTDFFKTFLPERTAVAINAAVSAAGMVFSYMTGQADKAMEALLIMMVLDYLSGIIAACIAPGCGLSSCRGFKGIVKKILMLLMVAAAHFVDYAVGREVVREMVIFFFISNEGLSILENAARAGLPVPEKFKRKLGQLGGKK
ncbi:phage holin family protein [Pectinatus haikarae]|uniref:Toxin secretion/phage lysis holin n=1 Tax=Pectinatus haikarae TaxID=349096 RepID=A0ABT9Y432_9FIRM|nr:phage holin family protein [Pectinatus haikarae]MDQ0202583.1 toxin secretion/phage lysis holin [Pectinatus haikarae]